MSEALPSRPNLEWLKKTAKQQLQELRSRNPAGKLADAQLALARQYGFSSWRALKAHVEQRISTTSQAFDDRRVGEFLRDVGAGRIEAIRTTLATIPEIVNAVGPHPYWGGRPQALHVSIESQRRDVFDLLLDAGADVNGDNALYDHWSPLMLTYHWNRSDMHDTLLARGARIGVVEALMAGDDGAVRRMLLRGKAALSPAPNGGSILAFARRTYAIDRLLELDVATDVKDRWETTPIEAMSRLGPRGQVLVEHLVSRGIAAPPETYARMGDRRALESLFATDPQLIKSDDVLMGAVDFGHQEIVQWLLGLGANPNARASIGARATALHSAAWEGNLPMVRLLVHAGADIKALDHEYHATPEGWARTSIEVTNNSKCTEVAEFLREVAVRGLD
jgi:Ankyrin repeats (many copies)